MASQQTLEEAFSRSTISFGLKIHIYHFTILVHGSPKVRLLAIDLHKHFIDEEGITVSSVLSLQELGIFRAKFITPQTDRFMTYRYSAFSKQILYGMVRHTGCDLD